MQSYLQSEIILLNSVDVVKNLRRGATATNANKARALPKFWVTVNPISTRGADYAHHSTTGLVWLKYAVALLIRGTLFSHSSRFEKYRKN